MSIPCHMHQGRVRTLDIRPVQGTDRKQKGCEVYN